MYAYIKPYYNILGFFLLPINLLDAFVNKKNILLCKKNEILLLVNIYQGMLREKQEK